MATPGYDPLDGHPPQGEKKVAADIPVGVLTDEAIYEVTGDFTANKNVIRGLNVVFSSSGSFNEGWQGKIYVGAYYKSPDEIRATAFGTQDAGATSAAQRLAIRNDGSTIGIDCSVKIVNKARFNSDNHRGRDSPHNTRN